VKKDKNSDISFIEITFLGAFVFEIYVDFASFGSMDPMLKKAVLRSRSRIFWSEPEPEP
jgi:hypothetical protein